MLDVQLAVYQDSWVPFCRAAVQLFGPQSVLLQGFFFVPGVGLRICLSRIS